MTTTTKQLKELDWKTLFVFIVPSILGVFLFMTPFPFKGEMTIPIAILAKELKSLIQPMIHEVLLTVICSTALLSLVITLFKPQFLLKINLIKHLFSVNWLWLVIRLCGAVFVYMTVFKVGPEFIHSQYTGELVLNDLLPVLLSVFIMAGLLLPLLLNFGLLELVGTLLTKVMRPLFGVPGRGAVNCVASWLGDGSVGVLMTSKQYEEKFYTQKEAAIIGTTFSAVSITFCLVVIGQVKLEHLFAPFYLTVCLAGLVAAIIVPRLPPLRFKKDSYVDGTPVNKNAESVPDGKTLFTFALEIALNKAKHAPGVKGTLKEGLTNALDMVFAVLPVVMAVGTFALIIAEHTPVFQWLGTPFVPYLELLQVPEAEKAAKTIVVGFADMFIPSILAASSIESDVTRFIVAATSVTQLIYMSEIGALILGSKIPVNIVELFVIFILRTIITLPVIVLMAHWLVG